MPDQTFQQAIQEETGSQAQPAQETQTQTAYPQGQPSFNWQILIDIPLKVVSALPNIFSKMLYFLRRIYK